MEDPNYEQTDIFTFMKEKPARKKQRVCTKKAALSSEQKRAKAAISEETSLFGEGMAAEKKPARVKKASPKASAASSKAAPKPKAAAKKGKEKEMSEPGNAASGKGSWREKVWEFDITHPSQDIKDTMKEALVAEGFMNYHPRYLRRTYTFVSARRNLFCHKQLNRIPGNVFNVCFQ